jgi:hypothetical protein
VVLNESSVAWCGVVCVWNAHALQCKECHDEENDAMHQVQLLWEECACMR